MNGLKMGMNSWIARFLKRTCWVCFVFLIVIGGASCSYFRTGEMSYQELDERNKEAKDKSNIQLQGVRESWGVK